MWSLKQSLKWDEDTFGLECDLGEGGGKTGVEG